MSAAFRMWCRIAALALLVVTARALAAEAVPDPLTLDAKALQAAGIVIDRAALRPQVEELKAPGEVVLDADSTVVIAPRVESQVLARKVRLGDLVHAGDPLVVLSSVEVAETAGALIVAEQDWRRVAALGPQAVSARRYGEARSARDRARARLRAFGLADAQINAVLRAGPAGADGRYALLAPGAGRITTDAFLVGERVVPGRVLFTLAREDSVWVEAQLAPGAAERIKPGAAARVLAHGTALAGTVIARAHQTNERTRTTSVRIEVDNREDRLHPGELVEVRLATGDAAPQLAVPVGALVLLQNQPTVFIATGLGRFAPAPVVTGATRAGWVVITQGLRPGDRYVREGAFALKARLLRSQLGEE